MPSKKEYDLVSDDGYDSRIPLHNEDAFQHGIQFQAKYIGTLDVPRPSSRVEIVAAMRRIRYEFKAKAIKKKKVDLTISVEGVKVSICKKKKKLPQWYDDSKLIIVQHPIYRIFYVSHDSQDLNIWSYIARDGATNVFKCNVFKSYKKEQAMRIVRTIGQAFEVCHKLTTSHAITVIPEQVPAETDGSQSGDTDKQSAKSKDFEEKLTSKCEGTLSSSKGRATPPNELALRQAQQLLYQMASSSTPTEIGGTTITSPMTSPQLDGDKAIDPELPVSSRLQVQLLRQQVEHHQQQTQVAVAQVQLLKEQLAAETAARIESQARTHQLLLQNRDLLDHMNQLLVKLHEMEIRVNNVQEKMSQGSNSQLVAIPDSTTPQCGPIYMPRRFLHDGEGNALMGPEMCMIENSKPQFDTDSPDSGHQEMSDNLSLCAGQVEGHYWDVNQDERVKYSFGYSLPVKYRQMSYEMTAVVNSNPFVMSHAGDKYGDQEVLDFSKFENTMRVSAPRVEGEENNNKLHTKLEAAPKLRPPPEFRNGDSQRNSIISDDSSNSSNSDTDSIKDGIVNFTDSDYYSHTGSSTRTNIISQLSGRYGDGRYGDGGEVQPPALLYKPKLQYHYNNLMNEELHFRDCYDEEEDEERLPRTRSRASFSDEDNTESYDEGLAHPPSPQPPPSRLEEIVQDD